MTTQVMAQQNKIQILSKGFSLFLHNFWKNLPFSFLLGVLGFIFPMIIDISNPLMIFSYRSSYEMFFYCLLYFAGWLTLSASLVFSLYCSFYHIQSHILHSLYQAITKLVPLLLLGALYALMIFGGTMLMIVPGIFLSISLMFAFILTTVENTNILQTLLVSHRLVWGNWWHTFLLITFPIFIYLIISLLTFVIFSKLAFAYGIEDSRLFLITLVFNIVIQVIFIPLIFSIAIAVLDDLRQRYTPQESLI